MFPYEWRLANGFPAKGIRYHGAKVFSCFAGGGGSSMGYKLAGYDVVGCCEIDPRQVALYTRNLKPRFVFQDDIRKLAPAGNIPNKLRDLDILDGSPPCTLFSTANYRSMDKRGKTKKFREGQTEQVLDDLFFWFIDLAERLKPKVVVAENVSGMLVTGMDYVRRIIAAFDRAGYFLAIHDVNGADMGLPQARLRLFFTGIRKDLAKTAGILSFGFIDPTPKLSIKSDEAPIPFRTVSEKAAKFKDPLLGYSGNWNRNTKFVDDNWALVKPGGKFSDLHPTGNMFSWFKLVPNQPVPTLSASFYFCLRHYAENRAMTPVEYALCSSFPLDYDWLEENPYYVMGMSVPPVMMAHVANRVREQWLDKINASAVRAR